MSAFARSESQMLGELQMRVNTKIDFPNFDVLWEKGREKTA